MAARKLDLFKEHKADYVMPKAPVLVNIKSARYLSFTGKGEPGGEAFQAALAALFSVAYTVKMTKKFEEGVDYKICALEGLWWGAGGCCDFSGLPPAEWNWKLIIRTPDFVGKRDLAAAVKKVKQKGKTAPVEEVKLETIKEGPCVQALHVGAYSDEPRTIERMRAFAESQGKNFHGVHHEIYLSDPRRVKPEKLRTILRMPVK